MIHSNISIKVSNWT